MVFLVRNKKKIGYFVQCFIISTSTNLNMTYVVREVLLVIYRINGKIEPLKLNEFILIHLSQKTDARQRFMTDKESIQVKRYTGA